MKAHEVDKSGLWGKRIRRTDYDPKDYFDIVLYYKNTRITLLESGGDKLEELAPHLVEDPDEDE